MSAAWLAVRAFVGRVPRWAWIALAVVALGLGGYLWHHHAAGKAISAAEKRGEARAYANVAKKAGELQRKADALNTRISTELKDKNDEANRAIARDADDLRLRGPGKAACSAGPGIPRGAGGHVTADRSRDAAVAGLSDEERVDLIGVPFAGAVAFAEQHDGFRVEALSWREWHRRFSAEWAKYQAEAEKARKPD